MGLIDGVIDYVLNMAVQISSTEVVKMSSTWWRWVGDLEVMVDRPRNTVDYRIPLMNGASESAV